MSTNLQQALKFLEQDFMDDKITKVQYYDIKHELLNTLRVKNLTPASYKYIRKCYNSQHYQKIKDQNRQKRLEEMSELGKKHDEEFEPGRNEENTESF